MQVELTLNGAESMDSAVPELSFSTNQAIFTISPDPLTAANGTTAFEFNADPFLDLAATSPSGMDLVLDATNTFYALGGVMQEHFSGTIGTVTFSSGASPTPGPGAMILMGAGLAVVALIGRKSIRRR